MGTKKKKVNNNIKKFAMMSDLNYKEMAELLNMQYASFVNKINSGTFDLNEMITLTAARDAQIAIVRDNQILFQFNTDDLIIKNKSI